MFSWIIDINYGWILVRLNASVLLQSIWKKLVPESKLKPKQFNSNLQALMHITPIFFDVLVMQTQHLLFISYAQIVILPTYSHGCLLFITSVNKHALSTWPPSISLGIWSDLLLSVQCFPISAFFILNPCVLSFWPRSITFCSFGDICCFHPFWFPMTKLWNICNQVQFWTYL